MQQAKGFTFVELMIVLVILTSLAAVAIPNILRSKMAASEAEAVAQLKCIAVLWYGNPWLGLILFLAMTGNLMIAGVFGTLFPLALKALHRDPALASSIFITTATDVGGFFVFLGLATLLLGHLH
ncbi:MAG: prepilin-type N-terminal cleavage/methylation domain-containing protein [Planctomycetes bacterium]|nr:prepilin-type N-terminal cleavage/methylation domain-containing protein [Planctomycetota bacterium]